MHKQRGFTYLGVLLAIALMGIGVAAVSEVWAATARRQRMEQLEWAGQQYAQAIGSYYEATQGRGRKYPRTLQDLVEDNRYLVVRRHLRQIYPNPMTGREDWELLRAADGGIRGVRALPREKWKSGEFGAREFTYVPVS